MNGRKQQEFCLKIKLYQVDNDRQQVAEAVINKDNKLRISLLRFLPRIGKTNKKSLELHINIIGWKTSRRYD